MAVSMQKQSKKHRRKLAAPIGGLFVALALIGVVTVIVASIRLTFGFLDNDSEKRRFEDLVRPVVMFNPVAFDNPADQEMPWLLRCGIWSALMSEKRASYEYTDSAELVVPASDVEVAVARLFGSGIGLEHKSIVDTNIYNYEEENGIYTITTDAMYVYSPRVMEITKDGDFLNLLVAYIPPDDAFSMYTDEEEIRPEKYMTYVISQDSDGYHIAKVKDPPPEYMQSAEQVITNGQ